MATLTPVDSLTCCVVCNKKSDYASTETIVKLFLCGRCKLVRYCGAECQRAHWAEHKPYCIRVGSEIYYKIPQIVNGPVDAAMPSNPLNLRVQPPLLTPEHVATLCAHEKAARDKYAVKRREEESCEDKFWYVAPYAEAEDPILKEALAWRKSGDDPDARIAHLAQDKSKEDLVELLRRNVYEQLQTNEELKALSIMNQSNQLRTTELRQRVEALVQVLDDHTQDPVLPGPGGVAANERARARLLALLPEMREVKELTLNCLRATDYMYGIKQSEHLKAEWLLQALMVRNPFAQHHNVRNPLTLLTEDRLGLETQVMRKMVRCLVALGARGIDEGHFWELDDRRDSLLLSANHHAVTQVTNALDACLLAFVVENEHDFPF